VQAQPGTRITSEYPSAEGDPHDPIPRAEGDPHDPIPRAEDQALHKRCEALADSAPEVRFGGRLATYRCDNLDQTAGQALATSQRIEASAPPRAANDQPRRLPAPAGAARLAVGD
jgi:UDP-galactopyranose mutase